MTCRCGAPALHATREGTPLCCACRAGIAAHGDGYEEWRLLNQCRIRHAIVAAGAEEIDLPVAGRTLDLEAGNRLSGGIEVGE